MRLNRDFASVCEYTPRSMRSSTSLACCLSDIPIHGQIFGRDWILRDTGATNRFAALRLAHDDHDPPVSRLLLVFVDPANLYAVSSELTKCIEQFFKRLDGSRPQINRNLCVTVADRRIRKEVNATE